MKKTEQTYEQAFARLEEIVKGFEEGELDVDSLGARLKEARELLAFCKTRLLKAEQEVGEVLGDKA